MNTAENDLITAQELELHAAQQQVVEMRIVETSEGYELHAPLRAWIQNRTTIKGNSEVVIPLTEPRWRILRTRRANEPRRFKNLVTIFAYIEEKFPSVRDVNVRVMERPISEAEPVKQVAGKTSGKRTSRKQAE